MKYCGSCKQTKSLTEFNKRRKGYQPHCRLCNKVYRTAYYKNNRDREYRRVKERRRKLIGWYHELRSQLICDECGEDHPATLDFHHLDPSQKDAEIGRLIKDGVSQERVLDEIAKCQVLCSNCHRKLHWKEREQRGSNPLGPTNQLS